MTRIRIEPEPWEVIAGNARKAYPEECCGVMLGSTDEKGKVVRRAQPLRNVAPANRGSRYQLHNPDLLRAQREARGLGMSLIGIYHSHPDCGASFSGSDLEAACPWLSYLVLSVRDGEVKTSASWSATSNRPKPGGKRSNWRPNPTCALPDIFIKRT